MFRHILVPLDGSNVAEVVLPIVRGLGKELGAKVTLVRVVDASAIGRAIGPAATDMGGISSDVLSAIDETVTQELVKAQDYLSTAAEGLRSEGITVATEVRRGVAGEELLAAIETEGVDVAAVATHGRSGISRTLFGSVADKLIRESGKPVIVVKAN